MDTVQLDKSRHNRTSFDCGIVELNNYLKIQANQQSKRNNSRTFVLEEKNNNANIIGFYTLTMTTIDLHSLPESLQSKHKSNCSAGLIARLAIDQRYHGKGFGEWLLVDALKKLVQASDSVAFPFVIVDAKEGAKSFYEKFGFTPFESKHNKLFITLTDVKESL